MNRIMIAYLKAVKVWYTFGIPFCLTKAGYEKYYGNNVQVIRWGIQGLISTLILICVKEMVRMSE